MASSFRKMSFCVGDISQLHNLAALKPPHLGNLKKVASFHVDKSSNSILSAATLTMNAN
jgi:hypothetical protein